MFETSNDLSSATRQSVVEVLNEHLAGAIDLHLQAKQAHWNVKGPNFVALHDLFDRVAADATQYADVIAERAVALGGIARGSLQAVARRSRLREYPDSVGQWRGHVRAMQAAMAAFGRGVRRAIDEATALNDAGTADLFTEISRGADKTLWMIEAHIQEAPEEDDAK
jgi:starvation-inducible DNA-binding protein